MPVINADETSQLIYAGAGPYLVVNLDTADTVYIGQSRTVHTTDVPLPPQASAQLDGPWYVSTTDMDIAVELAVLPGSDGGYSNPVGVQIALDALGLAKDSSVQAVNSTLGSPAQDGTLTSGSALAQPAVPNMKFASAVNEGITTGVSIVAPPVDYRLWAIWLSYSAATNGSYASAVSQLFASVQDPAGTVLVGVELVIVEAFQEANDSLVIQLPGLPFTPSDACVLNVNNNNGINNLTQRASAGVMYSTP